LLCMKEITSYPLSGPARSSARIIMSMKFFIMRSCIFLRIFPSIFPPSTMIAKAVMFIHVLIFFVLYRYLSFILILS